MKRRNLIIATLAAIALLQNPAIAQSHSHAKLHVNPRWKECSFQLDASLTPSAWKQFTEEAGLVVYFRSLTDARPIGRGNFEISMLQWKTGIDDADAAWNDTFVHPDSSHWLFEGSGLQFPGLTARAGLTNNTDVGIYFTKNPNANYGFYGVQVQRSLLGSRTSDWAASARVSYVSMYGPEDVDFSVIGADVLASRTVTVSRWVAVSPYAGVSTYLSRSHEKSAVVNLDDESALGAQGLVGAAVQITKAQLGVEYSIAKVPTLSMKVGIAW
jgi:hypothetical protein